MTDPGPPMSTPPGQIPSAPGPPGYAAGGPVPGQPYPAPATWDPNAPKAPDTGLGLLAHLLSFVISIVGPLILWAVKRDDDPFVRHHSAQSFNFDVTMFVISILAMVVLFVGLLLTEAVGTIGGVIAAIGGGLFVLSIPFTIGLKVYAAYKAYQGEWYEYPLAPKMLK